MMLCAASKNWDKLGWEMAYSENVPVAQQVDVLRQYA